MLCGTSGIVENTFKQSTDVHNFVVQTYHLVYTRNLPGEEPAD